MNKGLRVMRLVNRFSNKMGEDRVRAHSAEASFFIIMSFFPFLILILHMIRFLPVTEEQIMITLGNLVPFDVSGLLTPVVNSLYHQSNGLLSAFIIAALWSASKSIIGLTDGLNAVYRIEEERNYIILRIRAMVYALFMAVALLVSLIILVFGYDIIEYLKKKIPILMNYQDELTVFPVLAAMILLVILFAIFYTFLPNRPRKFVKQLPGGVFASVAWTMFSYIFSIYLQFASNMSLLYGSFTSLVGIMMWLYICMYLLFIGAEINLYLSQPELFH